jgi:transcriptional regulator with PAS, ATPase and Fis domain
VNAPPLKLDPPIVGSSAAVQKIAELVALLARTDVSVLVTGESGTGKELVARNLHSCGPRRGKPFVAVNCAALNPGVLESELFGHGRGSFTGAISSHAGLFEQANGGTLFLDEIGELPGFVQAKLLRVLQDRQVRRVGSADAKPVDVRVVSATNTDVHQGIRDGSFRMDLFYRLNVVHIHLPPLRERPRDVLDLIDHFLETGEPGSPVVSGETREALLRYHWPGNIRELQNELARLVALHPACPVFEPSMLSDRIIEKSADGPLDVRFLYDGPLPRAVGYLEENLLRKTLEQTNWNKSQSARRLGLSRQGLLKKIKRYGIERQSLDPPEGRAA